jgi:nucleoside-diphosphate-sugar epimerase
VKKINFFCFGFGQVAKNFIRKLAYQNIDFNLNVTNREKSQKKLIDKISYNSFQFNENTYDKSLITKLNESDHILISIPPVNGTDTVIDNFKKILDKKNHKWITYLSATSVYGDHKGKWVNEKSDVSPTSLNGINRLNVEKSWMSLANYKDLPLQIFRLSGIYSNERNILVRIKSGKAKIVNKKNHFFSRIHVEDIANVLLKSLKNFRSKEIYNISDDKPASSEEITMYAAKLLGLKIPDRVDFNLIESEMLRDFYKDSKKVSNKKMKLFFNYELVHPTYIEGLNHIRDNSI